MNMFMNVHFLKGDQTRVAVVPDGGVEAVLVAIELEGNEPLVFQSLPGDDVDGRLVLPATVAVGAVPFLRR